MRFLCLKTNQVMTAKGLAKSRLNIHFNFKNAENWPRAQMEFGKFERIFDTPPPADNNAFVNRAGRPINPRMLKIVRRFRLVYRLFGISRITYDGSGFEKIGEDYHQTWIRK
jgi:hypothetical protein